LEGIDEFKRSEGTDSTIGSMSPISSEFSLSPFSMKKNSAFSGIFYN
jgi:hypothetical protein